MPSRFNTVILLCILAATNSTIITATKPFAFTPQPSIKSGHNNHNKGMASSSGGSASTTEINPNFIGEKSNLSTATKEFRSPFLPQGAKNERSAELEQQQQRSEDEEQLIALIVLNSPIEKPPSPIFTKLWNISSFRVCADGGANRLYYATVAERNDSEKSKEQEQIEEKELYIPDLIKGDLDSLQPSVREYYQNLKGKPTSIVRDADQDCNDLDKSLRAVRDWFVQKSSSHDGRSGSDIGIDNNTPLSSRTVQIYVYGAFGGRFDQEMASIQALFRWKDEFQYNIALYTDETFAILLPPYVRNEIRLPFYSKNIDWDEEQNGRNEKRFIGEGPTVGLIPIGCVCDGVKTEGFKWNLDGTIPLEFGGLVSTSNRADDEVMVVECLQPLVFTAEMTRTL